jgi:hypothetical protein
MTGEIPGTDPFGILAEDLENVPAPLKMVSRCHEAD